MSANNEKLMTASEVAEILQVSKQFVLDHASGKSGPMIHRVKMGGAVRFRQKDVDVFIDMCSSALSTNGRAPQC